VAPRESETEGGVHDAISSIVVTVRAPMGDHLR
jgi:hypothetical protein